MSLFQKTSPGISLRYYFFEIKRNCRHIHDNRKNGLKLLLPKVTVKMISLCKLKFLSEKLVVYAYFGLSNEKKKLSFESRGSPLEIMILIEYNSWHNFQTIGFIVSWVLLIIVRNRRLTNKKIRPIFL